MRPRSPGLEPPAPPAARRPAPPDRAALRTLALLALPVLLGAGCEGTLGSPQGAGLAFQVNGPGGPGETVGAIQIVLLLTALSLAPALLILTTSFTRMVIVLSVTRSAIGLPQVPPNQVIIGLALFLSFYVMAPTWGAIQQEALAPYLAGEVDQATAAERAGDRLREFMLAQTREGDLALFLQLGDLPRPQAPPDVSLQALVPAFAISELRTAFQMAFVIYIPFLIIDIVVASTLLSMGMLMLPPTLISLPFKLILFVLVDGWRLITQSLVLSFQ